MTVSETKTLLIDRIGWKDDKTVTGLTLSAANLTTDSGLFFQDEHSAITLVNIRDCQPIVDIIEADFQGYLEDLKSSCALYVLNDVFEKDYVSEDLLTLYPSGFDKVLSLRMAIVVSELIMTASRINPTKRITDEFVGKLNYDAFGEHSLGIHTKYMSEVKSVQRRFGNQRLMLKTITKGQIVNEPHKNTRYWD